MAGSTPHVEPWPLGRQPLRRWGARPPIVSALGGGVLAVAIAAGWLLGLLPVLVVVGLAAIAAAVAPPVALGRFVASMPERNLIAQQVGPIAVRPTSASLPGDEVRPLIVGAIGATLALAVHGAFDDLRVLSPGLRVGAVWALTGIGAERSAAPRSVAA